MGTTRTVAPVSILIFSSQDSSERKALMNPPFSSKTFLNDFISPAVVVRPSRDFLLVGLFVEDWNDHDLRGGYSGREDQSSIIAMAKDCSSDEPPRNSPRCCPAVVLLLILSEVLDLERH